MKQYATSTGRATAADATLIFGGRAITTTGMGKLIENVRVNELKLVDKEKECYIHIIILLDSTTGDRRSMLFLVAQRMFWAIWEFARQ